VLSKRGSDAEVSLLNDILDALACQTIIVRDKQCDILFMNAAARSFFKEKGLDCTSCHTGYGSLHEGLCEKCPHKTEYAFAPAGKESDGLLFSFSAKEVSWLDGKPASLITYLPYQGGKNDKRLYELAYLDSLTGLPNRLKLRENFEKTVAKGTDDMCGAVALIDLDNFKAVNDTYGHNTGDVMLKRFVTHMQENPNFAGHLYRLGGDEFVLFYAEKCSADKTFERLRKAYTERVSGAFYSYTMPGIDLACTISMGISIFTERGATFSELLRKADIALYKAKSEGRNRLVFFDDKKDTARKFEDYYITIRPILSDYGKTYGYELIDSDSKNKTFANGLNLNSTEVNRAIDALSLCDLESDTHYFISYSNQFSMKALMQNFPKDKFIIQVQLPEKYTHKDLEPYHALRSQGYLLALVGFNGPQLPRELLQIFDYFTLTPSTLSIIQKKIIDANPQKIFIAANVDTIETFEHAKNLGFKLFQGQFFNQPIIAKKEKSIDPLRLNYLQLLKLASAENYLDFAQISKIISADLALSYKLLRLINSVSIGLRNNITSIPTALSYLGEEKLKKWIALLALRGIFSDNPLELVRVSLIRARFGELLAPYVNPDFNPDQVFLFGMFSLLHIMLEISQEELFKEIQMPDEIQRSLLTDNGAYSPLLSFFKNYELANWDDVTAFTEKYGLSSEMVYDAYIEAINWYNSLVGADAKNSAS